MDVSACRAVIIVFAMEGCGACEDFKPRLEREILRWRRQGAPFIIVDDGQDRIFGANEIPVLLLDAQSPDEQIQALANEHNVEGLPTTILYRRHRAPNRFEGAIDDERIYGLLLDASRA